MNNERQKEKRPHEGGVGPKMRSPAELRLKNTTGARITVNGAQLTEVDPA
jgi:hypothetical protein